MIRQGVSGGRKAVKDPRRSTTSPTIRRPTQPGGMQTMTPSLYEQILKAIRHLDRRVRTGA